MKRNRFKQDNRGASLLAVLVLMVVVSLIAVVITKITIVNIEMKEVERGTKKNFYSADELMDNLRAGARELAEQSLEKAYADVLENYLTYSASGGDVQKVFAIRYEENDERRALEFAADKMGVEKKMDFHRALGDAYYTACILQKIEDKYIFPNSSLDVYQNPKSKREEIHISYPTYDKYVSREFYSREKAMKDREVTSTKCPLCHNPAKRKIRWFMNNSKVYYSVSLCQEHGFVLGKIRIRRTEDNKYYVIKKLTNVTDEEADEIRQKRDAHRAKRRLKKEEQ